MATLQDVNLSQEGAQPQEENVQQLLGSDYHEAKRGYKIFKLVNNKKKGRVYIDGIDDAVMNPKTKKRERIWLLNGVDSIWQSDLVEILKNKDFLNQNRRSLQFEGGIMRVPEWDDNTLEFIKHCRHFVENKDRRSGSKYEFFEYNPQKQQEAQLKKEMLEVEMTIEASKLAADKVRKLASFVGVIFFDDLGQPKTDDGLKRELMLYAKRQPEKFKELLDSKEVDVAFLVKKAILDAKIDIGGTDGNAKWANSGGLIAKIPHGRKAQEYLTELALTNSEEGKSFLERLKTV